jgi:hypothetical protein
MFKQVHDFIANESASEGHLPSQHAAAETISVKAASVASLAPQKPRGADSRSVFIARKIASGAETVHESRYARLSLGAAFKKTQPMDRRFDGSTRFGRNVERGQRTSAPE